jgi:hypothetical protein
MMTTDEEYILVSPATTAGEHFVRHLEICKKPFALIVNSDNEKNRWSAKGLKHIIQVDTTHQNSLIIPELPIGSVYLFERSLPLCCRYIQISRPWTGKSIYVITGGQNARMIYKALGADYVLLSNGNDVSFLI